MKKIFSNIALLIISTFLTSLLAEGLIRLVVDPVGYLMPLTVDVPILGFKIEPNSGGHDSWGYRNKEVPTSSKVVAIGDSHTYGISATMQNSWPEQLERMSETDVYNLALGGYGPIQYSYLLEENALKLSPEIIIAGYYLGNDNTDSYRIVNTKDYWKHLRNNFTPTKSQTDNNTVTPVAHGKSKLHLGQLKLHQWFSSKSIIYRMLMFSFIGEVARSLTNYQSSDFTIVSNNNINTTLYPHNRLDTTNLELPYTKEGFNLSLQAFKRMDSISNKHNIHFYVMIIPLKESVLSEFITPNTDNYQIFSELFNSVNELNNKAIQYFKDNNIKYILLLKDMQEQASKVQIYPNNENSHPNKNGYEIIAKKIYSRLKADNLID